MLTNVSKTITIHNLLEFKDLVTFFDKHFGLGDYAYTLFGVKCNYFDTDTANDHYTYPPEKDCIGTWFVHFDYSIKKNPVEIVQRIQDIEVKLSQLLHCDNDQQRIELLHTELI